MKTLTTPTPIVNPRDAWPAWTDANRWMTNDGPHCRAASDRHYRGSHVVKSLDCFLDFYPRPSLLEGGAI